MSNPVVRWQMISPTPDATVAFYRQLFGWSVTQDNALGYREITAGDGGIHGGVWPGPAEAPAFVQLFIQVADADASIAEAVQLGAKVLVPKSTLPDGTAMAVLLDPLGQSFAICTSSS